MCHFFMGGTYKLIVSINKINKIVVFYDYFFWFCCLKISCFLFQILTIEKYNGEEMVSFMQKQ